MISPEISDFLKEKGYDLCERIGRGSSAECYKIYSQKYQQYFACKIMRKYNFHSNNEIDFFHNELRVLSNLTHLHILHLYDYFITENHIFMVLEYCEYGDLQKHLREGTLSKALLMNYIDQLLDALSFLEANHIAHKDLKPSNIYIDSHRRVKLGDFGLSLKMQPEEDELHSDFSGSLGFMPPEIYHHKKYNPLQADVWSFGICVYYLVTGGFPYKTGGCAGVCEFFTEGLDEKVLEMLDPIIVTLLRASLVVEPSKRATFHHLYSIFHEQYKGVYNSQPYLLKPLQIKQRIYVPRLIPHSRFGSSRSTPTARANIARIPPTRSYI